MMFWVALAVLIGAVWFMGWFAIAILVRLMELAFWLAGVGM